MQGILKVDEDKEQKGYIATFVLCCLNYVLLEKSMATLTEISIISRKLIRYSIYAVILILIIRFSLNLGKVAYKKLFPPKVEPPTVAYGKLPILPFPERPEYKLSYTLELPEGSLPVFPDRAEVYRMPEPQTNIKALDDAKSKARSLGFDPNGKPLHDTLPNVYIFPKRGYPSSLTMNIITGLFSVSYNINEDPLIMEGDAPPAEATINEIKNLLNRAGILTESLKNGTSNHLYLKIESGEFVPAISLSEAKLTKVNLFRKPYGKNSNIYPVTPKMPQANIWFIIAGGHGKQVITGEYHYFEIDSSTSATYPLKTSETAWEELKDGNGFIANIVNNPEGNIIIRRVYLGYYDAGQYTEYYQPVVVFEGDNDFYAYVPAITDEYYDK